MLSETDGATHYLQVQQQVLQVEISTKALLKKSNEIMEEVRRLLVASASTRLQKHGHHQVQELLALLLAAALDAENDAIHMALEGAMIESVLENFKRPTMSTVFEQVLASFLILHPRYCRCVLRAVLHCIQHGPNTGQHPGHACFQQPPAIPLVPYNKKLCVVANILACFSSLSSEVSPEGLCLDVMPSDLARDMCVALLREMALLYCEHQGLAQQHATHINTRATQAFLTPSTSTSAATGGIYIHPNGLVQLFVDALLRVPRQHRQELLVEAISAWPQPMGQHKQRAAHGHDEGGTAGKRQRLAGAGIASSVAIQQQGISPWGLLLAQACHDDILRYGSQQLSHDVLHLFMIQPGPLNSADLEACSQQLTRCLTGMNESQLLDFIHHCCWTEHTQVLTSTHHPDRVQSGGVQPGSSQNTPGADPSSASGTQVALVHILGTLAGASPDSAYPPAGAVKMQSQCIISPLPPLHRPSPAAQPPQQQQAMVAETYHPVGVAEVCKTVPPLSSTFIASRVLACLVKIACDREGPGAAAVSAAAHCTIHDVLRHDSLVLPVTNHAAVVACVRAICVWAKEAPSTHVRTLAHVWAQVMRLPDQWRQVVSQSICAKGAVTPLLGPNDSAEVQATSSPDKSKGRPAGHSRWAYIHALLSFCNHLPCNSDIYALAVASFLDLMLQPPSQHVNTDDQAVVEQVMECILGKISTSSAASAPPPAAVAVSQQAYSYVEACRADMLRCCVLACTDNVAQKDGASGAGGVRDQPLGATVMMHAAPLLVDAASFDHNTHLSASAKRVISRVFVSDVDNSQAVQSAFTHAMCKDIAERCRVLCGGAALHDNNQ